MRNIVSPLDGIRSPFGRRLGAAPLAAPVNVTAPAISGTPTEGSLLTASTGVWSGNPTPTYAYQWNRGGVAISGQTASSYTVVSADIGQSITVTVTATNSQGSASATSAAVTGQAAASAPVNTVAPAISGSPVEGSTITSSTGTWTGNPTPTYTYQWRRGGSPIGGATSASYTVVSADVGQSITVTVTATNVAGSASATSAAVTGQAAAVAPTNSVAPAISGSPTVGSTLTSSTGTWAGTPTPTYTYQWNRAGSPISGQTASTYTVVSADIGQNITVTVTATNTAGSASATSAAVVGQAASSFSPSSLFAASEPGGWYDPSDFSTMFQDIFGTVPVTGVGQPVGLIRDKSRTINRGVNLVSNGTFTTDTTGWTAVDGTIAAVAGELAVTGNGGSYPRAMQSYSLVVGKTYRISVTVRKGTASGNAYIAHASGALYAETASAANVTLTYTFVATSTSGSATAGIFTTGATGTAYFDNFVVEEISPADAFQATPGARPLLQQEAGGQYYLAFDGTDDLLTTSSINLTATNKVTVFAGVRKLSDAATATLIETSNIFSSNVGAFQITAPGATSADYRFYFRGDTASPGMAATTFTAPITNVLTCSYDIAGPDRASEILPRVNGAIPTLTGLGSGTNQAGNFGNYAANIGARGTGSARLNGRLYSLIVLGRAATAGEITDTETWVNSKTGAY